MSNSIRNNVEFRKLLTRKEGATSEELRIFTGREYVYSVWSLRTMETATHKIHTIRHGRIVRFHLWTDEQAAKYNASVEAYNAKIDAKEQARIDRELAKDARKSAPKSAASAA